MKTLEHPKFGTCEIKSVIGNQVAIVTPSNEEKLLMKAFAEKFAGCKLKETQAPKPKKRGKLVDTGNGYFTLTYRGKQIEARDVHNHSSYSYRQTVYVNNTPFSDTLTMELINNSLPMTPDSIVIA